MTEFSGTLPGVGLPAIVRFLIGLKKSGRLDVSQDGWRGEIFLEAGQLRAATFGSRTGLAALDAIVEALPSGQFQFDSRALPHDEPSIGLTSEGLQAHLDELSDRLERGVVSLPAADTIPMLTLHHEPEKSDAAEPLTIDRGTLQTLLAVDGQRDVRAIIAQRGSFDALWQVASLRDMGLISVRQPDVVPVVVPTPAAPSLMPRAAEPLNPPAMARPAEPAAAASHAAPVSVHCPKLGFEDDPAHAFGRPTRLHRCFAAETPLPLSLDQQRELCLTEHFETCPRLNSAEAPRPSAGRVEPSEGGRIVRLPISARGTSPTPLRARLERRAAVRGPSTALAVMQAPTPEPVPAPVQLRPEPLSEPQEAPIEPEHRLRPGLVRAAAAGAVVIAAAAVLALPRAQEMIGGGADATATTAITSSAAPPAAQPTIAPQVTTTPAQAEPTPAQVEPTPDQAQATPAQADVATAQTRSTAAPAASTSTLLDEHFASNDDRWPSDPQGSAVVGNGIYRIATQQPGQFVAIGAPITNLPADVVVNASFRKVAGPAGGGYGIIVRDQDPGVRDGTNQDGHYYVLEVGDRGDVGIWRRDGDHWLDLLPWQRADAVKTGNIPNELSVRAIGNTLTFSVNGVQVASRTDSTYPAGGVGLFVGGDSNQVAVDHFSIQTP